MIFIFQEYSIGTIFNTGPKYKITIINKNNKENISDTFFKYYLSIWK